MKCSIEKIGLAYELSMRVLDPDRLERLCETYRIELRKLVVNF